MVSKKLIYISILAIGILLLQQTDVFAKVGVKDKNKSNSVNKSLTQIAGTMLDINSISTHFYNNGIGDIDPNGNSGLVFPKGSGKTAAFTSGLLWGGIVAGDTSNQPRVGGTAYRTGLQPGPILSNGLADDPSLDKYRIYRVRPDVVPGGAAVDLTADAFNEGQSASTVLAQYVADWTDWPANLGAPYFDGNHNGVYDNVPVFQRDAQGNVTGLDPTSDIPGVPGADQTIWFVANDLSPQKMENLYGAEPMGIEAQATYWAYNQSGAFGDMYFRKYKLINKGAEHNTINNMYVSMWADIDLGDAGDDFVGVDTLLSLQYCYNAKAHDQVYAPLPPPAIGFDFFQGPLVTGVAGQDLNRNGVDDAADFGIFNGAKVGPGKINLPMTAAYYFANGDPNIGDPPQADIQGSTQFYNFFRGLYGISGAPFVNPVTNKITTYALSGDPQTGQGWLDGSQLPAGDRRQGSASGPFTLAPGDTQEVVVAEICAGAIPTSDRLSAIGTLKFFDSFAQLSYDNFFNLPPAPPAPKVEVIPLPNQINLDWGEDANAVNATETFHSQGYQFQGYNVYQLPSQFATKDEAKRIATFDINDNLQVILAKVFDATSSQILLQPVELGTNSGLKRYLEITSDAVKGGTPLVNGVKYYFAVTSYGVIDNYNSKTPIDSFPTISYVENPIKVITVIPQAPNPGNVSTGVGAFNNVAHVSGLADGTVSVNIVDPSKLTGDTYDVFFTTRQEIRNANGDWVAASRKVRGFHGNHPDTLTGSSVDVAATYGPEPGITQLNCSVDVQSIDFDYADGVQLVLPAGVQIVSVPKFTTNNAGALITPDIQGQTINLGLVNHEYTGNGAFAGGETWIILVKTTLPSATTPLPITWTIFDDGYGGGPVDVTGTTIDTSIGTISRLAKYWNVEDTTTSTVKLANQSIVNGIDIYPRRDDYNTIVGDNTSAMVDGFHVAVNVGYEAPINYFATTLTKGPGSQTQLTHSSSTSTLDIQNYTIFGGTISSKAIDNFGVGTNDINELQKDYILKFTGVWDSLTTGTGQVVHFIKPGTGSLATIFQAASLANHPLNPSPGTNAPFLIRIPFEVWSKDDNRQVNLMFRDREQSETANPFYAWNPTARMYAVLVNSAYDSVNAITRAAGDTRNALATWVLVFYGTNYSVGDQVEVDYANPIQFGVDKYVFTPAKTVYSSSQAKVDVGNINVFPNPYYGVNSEEVNKYNRFVTFSHLPSKATIRIFNLAGVLVQTITKNDQTQFAQWDLNNQSNLPVASGLYIAYIDMPDLGTTKILKVAIVQEQQILDRF